MGTFTVTPHELQSLADQMSGLLGELSQATVSVGSGGVGAAQNARLEGAISGFVSDWTHGLGDLGHKLDEFAQRLSSAAGDYEGAEQGIIQGFSG